MGVKLGRAKFWAIHSKANIFKLKAEWRGGKKNVRFWTENWPYLGNAERYGLEYY